MLIAKTPSSKQFTRVVNRRNKFVKKKIRIALNKETNVLGHAPSLRHKLSSIFICVLSGGVGKKSTERLCSFACLAPAAHYVDWPRK